MKPAEHDRDRKCPSREDLVAYRDGMLSHGALDSIDNHLAGCRQCLSILDEMRDSGKLLDFHTLIDRTLGHSLAVDPHYRRLEEAACRVIARESTAPRVAGAALQPPFDL